ncbi:protein FRG1-like [Styela clava]
MSEYQHVRTGKLLLKGEKRKKHKEKKHKKHKKKKEDPEEIEKREQERRDVELHSGWWQIKTVEKVKGNVSIEFGKGAYVSAMDNGLFTLGPPHADGEGPSPTEQLTGIPLSDTKVAFKTGFDKYLGVEKNGKVVGISDAIGPKEQWEPIYQEGKVALLSSGNNCFMSYDEEGDIVASSRTAGKEEILQIRSNAERIDKVDDTPVEEKVDSLKDCEVNYVKKFQSFQDRRLRINEDDSSKLDQAKSSGKLHEALLDRRSKMKADRYCKV